MSSQNTAPENIHPEFHRMLDRRAKEELLQQKGRVIWLYGLSGSGKSTLANQLERRLHEQGRLVKLLDGDNVRSGLNNNLGFSDEDRLENIRRVAEVAKLFSTNGTITLASFITPKKELRQLARDIIGEQDFNEIYVKCSFETCAQRDVKGLYAKAKAGDLKQFTGKDSSFEEPATGQADLVIDTGAESESQSLEKLYQFVSTQIAE
ncbi:MAG: adenylyl-sulfate kinase [Verrucomicrobiales bacterium]|nr:adenylyl-sulfate kinase [Verrucomicrobiales bacterium]